MLCIICSLQLSEVLFEEGSVWGGSSGSSILGRRGFVPRHKLSFRHADAERFGLRFGQYRTPRFKYGDQVKDARRGPVTIVGLSDAAIPWPIGAGVRGAKSLVLFGALARAVRRESNQAVAQAWGVTGQTVTAWRRALGVGPTTDGTSTLRSRARWAN